IAGEEPEHGPLPAQPGQKAAPRAPEGGFLMNRDHYRSAMDRLEAGEAFRQRLCEAAERRGQKRPAPPRLRWALPAACACLGLFAALWAFRPAAELPVQEASLPGEGEAVGAALPDGG